MSTVIDEEKSFTTSTPVRLNRTTDVGKRCPAGQTFSSTRCSRRSWCSARLPVPSSKILSTLDFSARFRRPPWKSRTPSCSLCRRTARRKRRKFRGNIFAKQTPDKVANMNCKMDVVGSRSPWARWRVVERRGVGIDRSVRAGGGSRPKYRRTRRTFSSRHKTRKSKQQNSLL